MSRINVTRVKEKLDRFDFQQLFTEELGWSNPSSPRAAIMDMDGIQVQRRQIAELSGVVVFEIVADTIPNATTRRQIHKEITRSYHENLLVFVDTKRSQSIWYWVKREGGKSTPREHYYIKGQPGDLFISKISAMVFDISRFEEGDIPIVEVAEAMRHALDVERVTKKFYPEFAEQRLAFMELIEGIDDPADRKWYASILLNRLMFIYFTKSPSPAASRLSKTQLFRRWSFR